MSAARHRVAPGGIDTPATRGAAAGTEAASPAGDPLRRPGSPEGLAAVAAVLASDSASRLDGAAVGMDGGALMP